MRAVLAAGAALMLGASAPVPSHRAGSLDWLGGRWLSEAGGGKWTEENWAPARGGVMLGTNLSGEGGEAKAFEFMRIVRQGADHVFYGSPGGAAPVAFRESFDFAMPNRERFQVTFENPEHDFPRVISYRRDGDRLTAGIAADRSGKDGIVWKFRRVRD